MRFVTLEDSAGVVECTFFPDAYRRFGHLFYHLGPFRVEGVVEGRPRFADGDCGPDRVAGGH